MRVAQRFAGEFHFQVDPSFQAPPPPRTATRTGRRSGGIPPFVYVVILFVILSTLERSWTSPRLSADLLSDRWRWMGRSRRASAVVVGLAVEAAAALAVSAVAAGSAAAAPADLGDEWHA